MLHRDRLRYGLIVLVLLCFIVAGTLFLVKASNNLVAGAILTGSTVWMLGHFVVVPKLIARRDLPDHVTCFMCKRIIFLKNAELQESANDGPGYCCKERVGCFNSWKATA